MGLNGIRKRGEQIELLGEQYHFLLTNYGYEYLAHIYGTSKAAEKKIVELSEQLTEALEPSSEQEVPNEYFDCILHFVRAGIEHNKYDSNGKEVRELPTFVDLKLNYSRKEIFGFVMILSRARGNALNVQGSGEEKELNPQMP